MKEAVGHSIEASYTFDSRPDAVDERDASHVC